MFFTFRQNNSGGYLIINDDVAKYLIIEAQTADDAIDRMYAVTESYSEYCPCCGPRWSAYVDDDDGTEVPMVFDIKIKEEPHKSMFGSSTTIYYHDGRKEKIWHD